MLKSIDTTVRNPSGSIRAFITVTIDNQDHEHMVDLPIGVEYVEAYINGHIDNIEADILEVFTFEEEDIVYDKAKSRLENIKQIIKDKKIDVTPYHKHPRKIALKIEYDKAKTVTDQIKIIAETVFGG